MAGQPDPTQLAPGVELVPRRSSATPAGMSKRESMRLGRLGGYTLSEIEEIAGVAARADMFKGLSKDQAIIKLLAGLELDLPLIQALSSIDVFDGGIQTRSNTLAAMVRRHPLHKYKIVEWDDEHCVIEWYERETPTSEWESSGPPTKFDLADAKRANLLDNPRKPAWQTYPRSMLRNRAIAEGARAYCGDALSNVYDRDEIDPEEYTPAADYARHAEKVNRPRFQDPIEDAEVIDVPTSTTSAPAEAGHAPTSPSEPDPAATPDPARAAPPPDAADTERGIQSHPVDATGGGAPSASLLEIIGSNKAEPGWRPITRKQQDHLRAIAQPLDSEGLGRVLAWATRNDGGQATSDPAQLREPRYQELKHLLENAPKGHADRAALVQAVVKWEESTAAAAASAASSSQGRSSSPVDGPSAGDAPTDSDGQGRLA